MPKAWPATPLHLRAMRGLFFRHPQRLRHFLRWAASSSLAV